jgi:hypothetical protein
VLIGVCTHLGCAPMNRFQPADPELGADWPGGFYCPCTARSSICRAACSRTCRPPLNLKVPPYRFMNDGVVQIGVRCGGQLMSATVPCPQSGGAARGSERLADWIDARFPMTRMWKEHASEYYAPKNFNFWYYFGVIASVGAGAADRHRAFS